MTNRWRPVPSRDTCRLRFASEEIVVADLFNPVGSGGNFHHNAVLTHHEDDGTLGAGYVAAGDALVLHWVERGPNDLLFIPIIMTYRRGIELLLKEAIRVAAGCLRRDGI